MAPVSDRNSKFDQAWSGEDGGRRFWINAKASRSQGYSDSEIGSHRAISEAFLKENWWLRGAPSGVRDVRLEDSGGTVQEQRARSPPNDQSAVVSDGFKIVISLSGLKSHPFVGMKHNQPGIARRKSLNQRIRLGPVGRASLGSKPVRDSRTDSVGNTGDSRRKELRNSCHDFCRNESNPFSSGSGL